jgi:hypothetical protein
MQCHSNYLAVITFEWQGIEFNVACCLVHIVFKLQVPAFPAGLYHQYFNKADLNYVDNICSIRPSTRSSAKQLRDRPQ